MGEYTKLMNEDIGYCANRSGVSDESSKDTDEAIDLMTDSSYWRSFSDGLNEFMGRCGYAGGEEISAKADYILEQFSKINVAITPSTVKDWVSGKRAPDPANEGSREKMYQLCFALHAGADDTVWFFEHVYFSKCFDYHRPNDLIYKFCMTHGFDYSTALSMIKSLKPGTAETSRNVMTHRIRQETDCLTTPEQLVDYINSNAGIFEKWNITAKDEIRKLRSMLQDEKCREADEMVRKCMKSGSGVEKYLSHSSLLIHWKYYTPYSPEDIFTGLQLDSVDFLLKTVMGTVQGITKKSAEMKHIPDAVRKSFPNKKSLSDILDDSRNASYISVRKALVFLKFVHFWCQEEIIQYERKNNKKAISPDISSDDEMTKKELYTAFVDEMNALLLKCGYSELFAGNPFDWLFMYSATWEFPLTFLGNFISDISDTGEENE